MRTRRGEWGIVASRHRLFLLAAVVTLAVVAGAGTVPASAQTSVRQSAPITHWDLGPGGPMRPAEG